MNTIKMESDLRLEIILLSITKDNINKLSDLTQTKEIDLLEKQHINKFIYLVNQINGTPSLEILKKEFPDLYFDGLVRLSNDKELDDYIRLYIGYRKNLAQAKKLVELSSIVRNKGVTEDIINELTNITKSDSVSIAHNDISEKLIDLYNTKIDLSGIKTGVKVVDESTGGLHSGALTTILGFTGSFKTTWAINMAYNAVQEGKNVCYLSLEVTAEHIFYDLISRHSSESKFKSHLEHLSLKHKKLSPEEYKDFEEKIYPDFLKSEGKIFVIDETELETYSFYSLENKFREIEKLAVEQTGKGIDMLVVDHAQLLKFDSSMKGIGQETNVVNAYVSFFRQCALNWVKSGRQISVLILSQASREGWKDAVRNDGKYKLTALAEANELERASSVVLSVFSSDTLKQLNQAKVQILKNRDGQAMIDPIEIFVDPKYYVFGDVNSGVDTMSSFDMSHIGDIFKYADDAKPTLDLASMDLDI